MASFEERVLFTIMANVHSWRVVVIGDVHSWRVVVIGDGIIQIVPEPWRSSGAKNVCPPLFQFCESG